MTEQRLARMEVLLMRIAQHVGLPSEELRQSAAPSSAMPATPNKSKAPTVNSSSSSSSPPPQTAASSTSSRKAASASVPLTRTPPSQQRQPQRQQRQTEGERTRFGFLLKERVIPVRMMKQSCGVSIREQQRGLIAPLHLEHAVFRAANVVAASSQEIHLDDDENINNNNNNNNNNNKNRLTSANAHANQSSSSPPLLSSASPIGLVLRLPTSSSLSPPQLGESNNNSRPSPPPCYSPEVSPSSTHAKIRPLDAAVMSPRTLDEARNMKRMQRRSLMGENDDENSNTNNHDNFFSVIDPRPPSSVLPAVPMREQKSPIAHSQQQQQQLQNGVNEKYGAALADGGADGETAAAASVVHKHFEVGREGGGVADELEIITETSTPTAAGGSDFLISGTVTPRPSEAIG